MNKDRIKFFTKIIEVLEELKIDALTYFGEEEQICIGNGSKSDFGLAYFLTCNELQILKEKMGCQDIIWSYGVLPGNNRWRFYKLVYDKTNNT